jgi:excisionase family DNA binding protein
VAEVFTAAAAQERAELVAALMALPFLTADEVAVIASCSPSTVRREIAAGRLVAIRLAARQWRIRPNAVERWLTPPSSVVDIRRGIA